MISIGLVIMKLNWTPNSFSDFAMSVTSLLPVAVRGLPKSLPSEESLLPASLWCRMNKSIDNNYFPQKRVSRIDIRLIC